MILFFSPKQADPIKIPPPQDPPQLNEEELARQQEQLRKLRIDRNKLRIEPGLNAPASTTGTGLRIP